MADTDIVLVVMDRRTGDWCPDCARPSVVTVTLAAGLRLMNITRCLDCLDYGAS